MEITVFTPGHPEWPPTLAHANPPPGRLYVRGRMPPMPGIAVVGTRRMTPYGRTCAERLTRAIAALGVPIMSGLAQGIDGIAHETALASGGTTFAVIGNGVDEATLFPYQHRDLASRIVAAGGGVMSEYPPGMPPLPYHFPARNRLIAALSRAVLVIEAPHKSGAMITAKLALEMGREVWAVPGPITHQNAEGPNRLIRDGATLIAGPDDVAHALGLESPAGPLRADLSEGERSLLEKLASGLDAPDALARALGLSLPAISALLTALELKALVRSAPGGTYVVT